MVVFDLLLAIEGERGVEWGVCATRQVRRLSRGEDLVGIASWRPSVLATGDRWSWRGLGGLSLSCWSTSVVLVTRARGGGPRYLW